jgi:hypothetical protein
VATATRRKGARGEGEVEGKEVHGPMEAGTGGANAGPWIFLPKLGGGRGAAGKNRRKVWGKASPAAEDEIDKLLRENPSLGEAWSDLTVMLAKHLWPLIFAPVIVH